MSSSMYGCSVLVDSSLDGWIGEIQVPTSYGRILIDISKTVPDGVVGFFPSYEYMELVLNVWKENHLLEELQRSKLLFIETSDGVESSLALQHFRTACDVGVVVYENMFSEELFSFPWLEVKLPKESISIIIMGDVWCCLE